MKHSLNITIVSFEAILSGERRFMITCNVGKSFQKGDVVKVIECTDPYAGGFTGRELLAKITLVTNFQQKENMIVFGFKIDKGGEIA